MKESCKTCELLREFISSKNGLPNYDEKRHCCILFTVICDRKNSYEDSVYEITDPDVSMCESYTPIRNIKYDTDN